MINPFVPVDEVKYVVIDGREKEIGNSLTKLSIGVIYTEKCNDLYDAISFHPDILIHPLGDGEVIIAPNVSNSFIQKLKQIGLNVRLGQTYLKRNYPYNIAYNVARLGNIAFHNLKYTDPILRESLEQKGIKFLNVKQGYTKCNMAIIDDNSFITSDKGIFEVAVKNGIEVLLIEPGEIILEGFKYGFVGGAMGLIANKKLAVTGSFKSHKNYKKIIEFLNKKGVEIVYLTFNQIKDIGSIIPLI
ncbi:DUF6873 family GME fold protein [Thermoanaerobacter kivui]|uniref:DUF6873 family GME fold protein n=1 Tax=Thermoanaerobacter kivui TaxID=2325 RepID=UPI0006709A23|nr:hypothetical protein [Thermoanaerobacter kivui]